MTSQFERYFGLAASALTIVGFVVTMAILPTEYKNLGYILSGAILVCTLLIISYFIGKNSSKPKTINPPYNIYASRDEMLDDWSYKNIILDKDDSLLILGGTLKDFTTEIHLDWIKKTLNETIKDIKILILNPSSQGSYLRALQENRIDSFYSDSNSTIFKLIKFLNSIANTEDIKRIQIKKYYAIPSSSMFLTNSKIGYSFYLNSKTSSNSIWYSIDKSEDNLHLFKTFNEHFYTTWRNAIPIDQLDNFLILFEGLPGTGKSTTAKALNAAISNSVLISSLAIRLENGLLDIFSSKQRNILHQIILGKVYENIALGKRKIILDVNLTNLDLRERLFSLTNKLKIDNYYFKMTASDSTISTRITSKIANDPLYKNLKFNNVQIINNVKAFSQSIRITEHNSLKSFIEYDTDSNTITCNPTNELYKFYSHSLLKIISTTHNNNIEFK